MKIKKMLIPLLICILGCMMLVAGCGESETKKEPESKTVTVTDSTGRSVELPQPLEKVVILNTDVAEAMRILGVQDKVVGVSDTVQKDPFIGMQDKEVVGTWSEPNFEKIVEVEPQVVISYASSGAGEEVAEKLKSTDVKVLLLDFYKPEEYDKDLKTLGKVFGKEDQADAFLKWKGEQIAILDKVKDIKEDEKTSVFTITTNYLAQEKWSTYGSGTATAQGLEMAGLDNVAGELEQYPEVSPEWILEQNPEAIILIDRTDGYLGYEVEGDTAVKDYYESIKNNKVLSKTDALKNEQFYVISSELLGADKTYLGALYLVKWFYPEQFTNMDPEKSLREYFDEWLDVPYQGEWAYPSASE
ncbi:MAG: ABC transporter substrate-binding protein [Syntrophaceticus sp.]|jgi:iron complex transport system substrate-binding protein|nr:ABC transporter substrate-binding protein [Eubacteriales bacterium]